MKCKTPYYTTKGKHSSQSGNVKMNHVGTRKIVVRSEVRIVAWIYAIRAREEATALDVVTEIFYLFCVIVYALIDCGSAHSYICTALTTNKNLHVKSTEFNVQVTDPLGHSVIVNLVCCNCPLKVQGYEFHADLKLLPFHEFDIISSMDWLSLHDAVVNYR